MSRIKFFINLFAYIEKNEGAYKAVQYLLQKQHFASFIKFLYFGPLCFFVHKSVQLFYYKFYIRIQKKVNFAFPYKKKRKRD